MAIYMTNLFGDYFIDQSDSIIPSFPEAEMGKAINKTRGNSILAIFSDMKCHFLRLFLDRGLPTSPALAILLALCSVHLIFAHQLYPDRSTASPTPQRSRRPHFVWLVALNFESHQVLVNVFSQSPNDLPFRSRAAAESAAQIHRVRGPETAHIS
jgi:hypothetical protein